MGLFIIAGLLIVLGFLCWVLDREFCEDWLFAAKIFCLGIGGTMLFILLIVMGSNRANEYVMTKKEDYTTYVLALESCDTMNDYMMIANKINYYNDVVEQHRKMRNNEMTNWLFSPRIAEMPLIVVPDFKLQEAE